MSYNNELPRNTSIEELPCWRIGQGGGNNGRVAASEVTEGTHVRIINTSILQKGNLLPLSKEIYNCLHKFGIIISYDPVTCIGHIMLRHGQKIHVPLSNFEIINIKPVRTIQYWNGNRNSNNSSPSSTPPLLWAMRGEDGFVYCGTKTTSYKLRNIFEYTSSFHVVWSPEYVQKLLLTTLPHWRELKSF